MEEQARLVGIENNREITKETDSQFWFAYQNAILLALKDNDVLNEVQYRFAAAKLRDQFRAFVKHRIIRDAEKGGD